MDQDAQKMMMELQKTQQSLQTVAQQAEETQNELNGVEKALEELKESEGQVYKSVGELLVERDRDDLEDELEESKEDLGIRLKGLNRKEEKLRKKIQENQEKFSQNFQG